MGSYRLELLKSYLWDLCLKGCAPKHLVIMRPAGPASQTTLSGADPHDLRNLLVTAAGAALLVLLVLTTLSMYKG